MSFLVKVSDLLSDGNVRTEADAGLVNTIKENGILVPLEVYRVTDAGTCWYVKDGHRRLTSAILAGLNEVPCVEVEPPTDRPEQIVHQYIINEERRGLTKLEKAEQYRRLTEEFGMTQKEVAAKFHVSEAEVSISLAALRAHPAIRDAMLEGKLSHSAVEPVLSLSVEDQGAIAPVVLQARTVVGVATAVKTYRKAHGIERTVRKPKVSNVVVNDQSADPMGAMAVDAIETALKNLQLAGSTLVINQELRKRGLSALAEILDTAEKLRIHLEIEPGVQVDEQVFSWDELANL